MEGLGTVSTGFSFWKFVKKYILWIIVLILILPPALHSVSHAIQTKNPTYPIFDLTERIFSADNHNSKIVDALRTDPSQVVGMAKPETGAYQHVKYGWFYFWNVIFVIFGNLWLMFLPLVIIYKIVRSRNTSTVASNIGKSIIFFLMYLIFVNMIALIYILLQGGTSSIIPVGTEKLYGYWLIILNIVPFHGLINLVQYIIQTIIIPKIS